MDCVMDNPFERGLVSARWVLESLKRGDDITILDGSMLGKPRDIYLKEHIPGAIFFDLTKIKDINNPLPATVPSPERFSKLVGRLGISHKDEVVVYDNGGTFWGSSRVWWMFKLFGHENVAVMEGGLNGWKAAGGEVESEDPSGGDDLNRVCVLKDELKTTEQQQAEDWEAGNYSNCSKSQARINSLRSQLPSETQQNYKIQYRPELLETLRGMKDNMESYSTEQYRLVFDTRRAGDLTGVGKNCPNGMIPHSISLPFTTFINKDEGKMLPADHMMKVFAEAGIPSDVLAPITCT